MRRLDKRSLRQNKLKHEPMLCDKGNGDAGFGLFCFFQRYFEKCDLWD